ncbi:hypothetical protein [Paenirhodobacter sp.]|uniref:hypothetical protein n=1 Tax=Paenirhodobacter sp. TaxID=1965326 RepID=UPI003B3E0E11
MQYSEGFTRLWPWPDPPRLLERAARDMPYAVWGGIGTAVMAMGLRRVLGITLKRV